MDDIRQLAGQMEGSWTGTSEGDIQEWATSIWESATKQTVCLPHVVRYDSPRTVEVPFTSRQSSNWKTHFHDTSLSTGSTAYDIDDIKLTPLKYRTLLKISREAIDVATWSVEQDIRNRLAYRAALKVDMLCYAGLDDGTHDQTNNLYDCAGNAVDTGTNVSVGTAMTIDHLVDGIDGIRQNSYYANTMFLRAEHHADLLKESNFLSAAQHGDASVLKSGVISRVLGCNVYVSENIPEDSGSLTLSFIIDDSSAIVGNFPNTFTLEPHLYWRTDTIEFCASCRGVAKQLDGNAAACLYGSA